MPVPEYVNNCKECHNQSLPVFKVISVQIEVNYAENAWYKYTGRVKVISEISFLLVEFSPVL
jgi:hypothetical protein